VTRIHIPRLMIAAPASGSGKTTVTCALLTALLARGERPAAFKCGPDYIDPLFHTAVTGAPARNLDLFLTPEDRVLDSLSRGCGGATLAVLEGVMGYYDGLGGDTVTAGSYHLARVTKTPVVLVLRCRGMSALTAAALVRGVRDFQADSGIAALLLDQLSPAAWPGTKAVLERETGLPVAGFLPSLPDCALESRHLGLVAPEELPGFREKARRLAAALVEHTDLELLQGIARSAPPLAYRPPAPPRPLERPVRVAVARDAAFSFYYQDSLELLERAGAELVPFSPLAGDPLPAGAAGLLLGGGYPELHARELSQNRSTREQLGQAILGGLPTVAECGGFLYLHRQLADKAGAFWPMAGVIPASARNGGRLQPFGYGTLAARQGGLLLEEGESIPAHAFHYWQSDDEGDGFRFQKPGGRGWRCGWQTGSLYAGFPHLHFGSREGLAERFLAVCGVYQERKR